jgi:hypothetical protein
MPRHLVVSQIAEKELIYEAKQDLDMKQPTNDFKPMGMP